MEGRKIYGACVYIAKLKSIVKGKINRNDALTVCCEEGARGCMRRESHELRDKGRGKELRRAGLITDAGLDDAGRGTGGKDALDSSRG